MTLILALGNVDQFIQISDRRLTRDGILVDDESSKSGYLYCRNARMAFGFSGLAKAGSFVTRDWLLDALAECGPPDYVIGHIIERLKVKATEIFNNNPNIIGLDEVSKHLSIMFSGYLLPGNYPRPRQAVAILTNYQNLGTGKDSVTNPAQFYWNHWEEERPADDSHTLIQRVGNSQAMTDSDVNILRSMLVERKPANAIKEKAIELLREIASRPNSQGTIGKQLMSIVIPANVKEATTGEYHTATNKSVYYLTDYVYSLPAGTGAIKNASIRDVTPGARPLVVPKVGRNQPCPCGSGEKYKDCHGKHSTERSKKRHKSSRSKS